MKQTKPLSPSEVTRLASGLVTGAEIARMCGISKQRACLLLRRGLSPLEIAMERRSINPGSGRLRNGKGGVAPTVESLADLQKQKLKRQVEHLGLDLQERTGEMVPRRDVEVVAAHIREQHRKAVRELMFLPSLLRDRCDGQSGATAEQIWSAELLRVLEQLARENRQQLALLGVAAEKKQHGEENHV